MGKRNPFTKEYYTGRKDQFDLDYGIFRKAMGETSSREEMITYMEQHFQYIIGKIVEENTKELMKAIDVELD